MKTTGILWSSLESSTASGLQCSIRHKSINQPQFKIKQHTAHLAMENLSLTSNPLSKRLKPTHRISTSCFWKNNTNNNFVLSINTPKTQSLLDTKLKITFRISSVRSKSIGLDFFPNNLHQFRQKWSETEKCLLLIISIKYKENSCTMQDPPTFQTQWGNHWSIKLWN